MQKSISKNTSVSGLRSQVSGFIFRPATCNLRHRARYSILIIAAFYLLSFSGCATVSIREAFPTYNINGTSYLSLISLCEARGISWEYDTFSRTVTLDKDAHKINLMLGDTLVLVDGLPRHLKHPVEFYQGTVAVPYKFKEEILDVLFKERYLPGQAISIPLKIKKIVIDAGHGGRDPGAIGRTGLREKDLTLDMAKRLSSLLRLQGIEVIMTRSTDRFISLSSRVDIANSSQADLFLSVHANANRVRRLNGFEVYYVSPGVDDSQRALSAAGEAKLNLDSNCFASSSLNLKATLWDMIYTFHRAESVELARHICRAIKNNLDTEILGIKGARFYVLRGVRMPAILIEIGFLSNYNEERMLKNSYYRQKIVEGVALGIKNYAQDFALAQGYK